MYYYFCITKQVILDVSCRLLPWKEIKMTAKQQIDNSKCFVYTTFFDK